MRRTCTQASRYEQAVHSLHRRIHRRTGRSPYAGGRKQTESGRVRLESTSNLRKELPHNRNGMFGSSMGSGQVPPILRGLTVYNLYGPRSLNYDADPYESNTE